MKTFNDIKLGMLVYINDEVESKIIGISVNNNDEIELMVRTIETKEEFFIMQTEVTYIN